MLLNIVVSFGRFCRRCGYSNSQMLNKLVYLVVIGVIDLSQVILGDIFVPGVLLLVLLMRWLA